jgi:hypothetical protein
MSNPGSIKALYLSLSQEQDFGIIKNDVTSYPAEAKMQASLPKRPTTHDALTCSCLEMVSCPENLKFAYLRQRTTTHDTAVLGSYEPFDARDTSNVASLPEI